MLNNIMRVEAGLGADLRLGERLPRTGEHPTPPAPKPLVRDGVRVPHTFVDDHGRMLHLPPVPEVGAPRVTVRATFAPVDQRREIGPRYVPHGFALDDRERVMSELYAWDVMQDCARRGPGKRSGVFADLAAFKAATDAGMSHEQAMRELKGA